MKKMTLMILALCAWSLNAQNHLVGVKAGANLTNVSSLTFNSPGFRTGLSAGLTYEYLLNDKFSIGADVLYAQRGFRSKTIYTDWMGNTMYTGNTKYDFAYLSVPIKFGYRIGGNVFGFANLGVCPALRLDSRMSGYSPFIFGGGTISTYNFESAQFDLAGLAEIGAGFKVAERFSITVAAAYQRSFTSFANTDSFEDEDAYHYGISLSAGVRYALGK